MQEIFEEIIEQLKTAKIKPILFNTKQADH